MTNKVTSASAILDEQIRMEFSNIVAPDFTSNPLTVQPYPNTENNIITLHPAAQSKHTQQKVLPIKSEDTVKEVYRTLRSHGRYGLRNAAIFATNLALGRRTSDILRLKLSDIYDFDKHELKHKISIKESKTGKMAMGMPIDKYTKEILEEYISTLKSFTPSSYLFPSQKKNQDGTQRPLNITSLNEIYKENTETIFAGMDTDQTHISSYAARKTYGYRLYKHCMETNNGMLQDGVHILDYLQAVYNHSSRLITLRYIGAWDDVQEELSEEVAYELKDIAVEL